MTIRADVDDLIAFLNSVAAMDPVAMGKLVGYRVPCNDAIRDHATIQVGPAQERGPAGGLLHLAAPEFAALAPDAPVVGLLGILNGYAGTYDDGSRKGWGPIAAIVEDDGRVTGFRRTPNE